VPSWSVLTRKFRTFRRRVLRNVYQRLRPAAKTTPVFIVGSQRSGTSMTLRVFALSLDATTFNMQDDSVYTDGVLLAPEIIHSLLDNSRGTVTVFKPMNEIQEIPQFLKEYPGVKIIWLVRNWADAVNSCIRQWPHFRTTLKAMAEDPENAGWHGAKLTERQRQALREHYHDDMSLESAYALFWYVRNLFYFEFALDQESDVRLIRYESIVQQPKETFREIFEFVGCPFSTACTSEIFSSSIGKNAEPDVEPAIADLARGLHQQLIEQIESVG